MIGCCVAMMNCPFVMLAVSRLVLRALYWARLRWDMPLIRIVMLMIPHLRAAIVSDDSSGTDVDARRELKG